MPVNGYNVGRDVSVDIVGTTTGVLRFRVRTGFEAKQKTVDIEVKRLDGIVDHIIMPSGWMGSFDYERGGDDLDSYFAGLENSYYSGLTTEGVNITQSITNPNGTLSQYRFTRAVLKYDDAGKWEGDKTVKQKISWMASRRLKVV